MLLASLLCHFSLALFFLSCFWGVHATPHPPVALLLPPCFFFWWEKVRTIAQNATVLHNEVCWMMLFAGGKFFSEGLPSRSSGHKITHIQFAFLWHFFIFFAFFFAAYFWGALLYTPPPQARVYFLQWIRGF